MTGNWLESFRENLFDRWQWFKLQNSTVYSTPTEASDLF